MFDKHIDKVIYSFGEFSPAYDSIANVEFSHGFSENLISNENLGKNTLLVIDDLAGIRNEMK